jgi:hypothetical protein
MAIILKAPYLSILLNHVMENNVSAIGIHLHPWISKFHFATFCAIRLTCLILPSSQLRGGPGMSLPSLKRLLPSSPQRLIAEYIQIDPTAISPAIISRKFMTRVVFQLSE